jgi:hypothetical protein
MKSPIENLAKKPVAMAAAVGKRTIFTEIKRDKERRPYYCPGRVF